jgi:hypothetical protein
LKAAEVEFASSWDFSVMPVSGKEIADKNIYVTTPRVVWLLFIILVDIIILLTEYYF